MGSRGWRRWSAREGRRVCEEVRAKNSMHVTLRAASAASNHKQQAAAAALNVLLQLGSGALNFRLATGNSSLAPNSHGYKAVSAQHVFSNVKLLGSSHFFYRSTV